MSASAGRVLLMPKGDYNASETYTILDCVTFGSSAYVCKKTSTGHAPTDTEYWQVLVRGVSGVEPEKIGIGFGISSNTGAARTAQLTNYQLTENGIVAVQFVDGVQERATLNINASGAIPIYYRGTRLADGVILDGDTVTFAYDGTNYNILCIDSKSGHAILDKSATALVQRRYLRFLDAYASDDSTNGITNVEIMKTIQASDYDLAADGIYADENNNIHFKKGTNNLKLKSQDVAYGSSTAKDAIDGLNNEVSCIAPIESTSTASRAYAVGEQFYYNGILRTATAAISQGGTITVGTNCMVSDTVVEQLEELKPLDIPTFSVSSLPKTVSNAKIKENMKIDTYYLSNPSAQIGEWQVSSSNGSLTITGSINGTTNVTLSLTQRRS